MKDYKNYLDINKNGWNKRTEMHLDTAFYDMDGFVKGKSSLMDIELALLGDVKNQTILHLQCHFGQDSLSLARMGAKVTGLDLSNKAIEEAKILNQKLGLDANFVCADVYSAREVLTSTYDRVFTTYGVLGWLPDLNKWAEIVAASLNKGGELILVEFHPVMWMFDDDVEYLKYKYRNSGALEESEIGSYADKESKESIDFVFWNHGLSDTIQALISHGLNITHFSEYDFSPYDCFGKNTREMEPGKYQIKGKEGILPMVYAIKAVKK